MGLWSVVSKNPDIPRVKTRDLYFTGIDKMYKLHVRKTGDHRISHVAD